LRNIEAELNAIHTENISNDPNYHLTLSTANVIGGEFSTNHVQRVINHLLCKKTANLKIIAASIMDGSANMKKCELVCCILFTYYFTDALGGLYNDYANYEDAHNILEKAYFGLIQRGFNARLSAEDNLAILKEDIRENQSEIARILKASRLDHINKLKRSFRDKTPEERSELLRECGHLIRNYNDNVDARRGGFPPKTVFGNLLYVDVLKSQFFRKYVGIVREIVSNNIIASTDVYDLTL
jgi:hypothetical protein